MRSANPRCGTLAAIILLAAACAQAEVVTVTPDNMRGWSLVANSGGRGAIAAFGPAVYETQHGFATGGGTEFGSGAFYASCTYAGSSGAENDKTPSTVWLGLDTFQGMPLAGVTLNRITTLKYYTYVSRNPTRHGGNSNLWDSWTWWRYPKQPISLQLTIEKADGSDRRQIWYRPWGATVKGDDLNESAIGRWQFFDCRAQGRWLVAPDYDGNPSYSLESWSHVLAGFGNYRLVQTSTVPWSEGGWMSPGWKGSTNPTGNPRCTGTGMCLNFQVGARFYQFRWPGESSSVSWWPESVGFRGHMDFFTLGIDGKEVTYNFEPSVADDGPSIVYTKQKSLEHAVSRTQHAQENYMFRISGKVVERGNPYFSIDDGSGIGIPTRVYWMNNPAVVGQYWTVWGFAERPRWTAVTAPFLIWADPSHATRVR